MKTNIKTILSHRLHTTKPKTLEYLKVPELKIKQELDVTFGNVEAFNYHMIVMFTRELIDTLTVWAERNIINKKDIYFLEKITNRDNNLVDELLNKKRGIGTTIEEFTEALRLLDILEKRALSDFQRKESPFMVELLRMIYIIDYISTVFGLRIHPKSSRLKNSFYFKGEKRGIKRAFPSRIQKGQ